MSLFLFAVFPYVAIVLAIVATVMMYRTNKFKFSSLSSQFLERDNLFWGSVPWHYGILAVLFGHLIGFCFPREVLLFGSVPVRLLIMEISGLIFGLTALVGLVLLIRRRIENKRISVVTSKSDVLILSLLLIQVCTGVATAIFYRWGINWYATSMVPYLRSLFVLSPELQFIDSMPWTVKVHILNAFVIVSVIPFTRFLHFLIIPFWYLWRPWQRVIWNYDYKSYRNPNKK